LLNTEHEVVNVDKLTYAGNVRSLKDVTSNKRFFFELSDICNRKKIETILYKYKPDKITHLVAESHVDRSIDDSSEFIQTNIVRTHTLLAPT